MEYTPNNYQQNNNTLLYVLLGTVLIGGGGYGYYLYQKNKTVTKVTDTIKQVAQNPFGLDINDLLNPGSDTYQMIASVLAGESATPLDYAQTASYGVEIFDSIYQSFGGEGGIENMFGLWDSTETDPSWLSMLGL